MKPITILGSTGSIGTQALEVARDLQCPIVGLAACRNVDLLERQAREFQPQLVCLYDEAAALQLKERLADTNIPVVSGMEGLCQTATLSGAETVLNAVVGMIGLLPTLEAIAAKKAIALANKETLVTGGALVLQAAKQKQVPIYPVDSEHSAIFQALQGNDRKQVRKIILTASGGPFFGRTKQELQRVTVQEALAHPNWSMGKKITVDSATLMNKGLELIEAAWLFHQSPENIEIVVQRESVLHSAVEYQDGSVIAQLGAPDMKLPIQYALTYPERLPCTVPRLSLTDLGRLTFAAADEDTFICLRACKTAMAKRGLYPTLVNGANEKAVELFLDQKISFLQIGEVVEAALALTVKQNDITLEDIIQTDQTARNFVLNYFSIQP